MGHFKRSYKATNALKAKQLDMNLPTHKLIQHCVTRWNSVYDMFSRILEQRWAVSAVLSDRNVTKLADARTLELHDDMWTLIEDAGSCLKSLKTATETLSADKYVCFSVTAPIIYSLVNTHLKPEEEDGDLMKQFKKLIANDLTARCKELFDDNDIISHSSLLVATFVDPRHKHMPFVNETLKTKVYSFVEEQIQEIAESNDGTAKDISVFESQPSTSKAATLLGENYYIHCNSSANELNLYKSLPVVSLDVDPILWWRDQNKTFPNMHKLAINYLTVPATSVSSERMFSAAGRLVTKARSSLSTKHVDQVLFLNKNK